jgi:uncharacterized spore protein YtfJ
MTTAEATQTDGTVIDVLRKVADSATVRTVFGDPITEEGVTLVPVARVSGGGGGGGGGGPDDRGRESRGAGSGMRLSARPVGAFVIRKGRVRWRPAMDVNRAIVGGQIVAVLALLTIRALARARMQSRK